MKKKKVVLPGKRGQIWVETVIYTLIAFSVMGLVLAFVVPKVQETQDRGAIDQSISILQDIDSFITSIGDVGNQRKLSIVINKGTMTINSISEKIYFTLDSRYQYSEPGKNVSVGKIITDTERKGDNYIVSLTLNYQGQYNITYNGIEEVKELSSSSVPYQLSIANSGKDSSGNILINTKVVG